ncbi:hypothetical protein FQN49_003717 [Arthroderma sp. PD_2]|nr:hypothetical protein FQN49_003717 [Arthroderma sp. PD_2]
MDKTKANDELESFRRQWLEEVRTRHPAAQPAQDARQPERKKPLPSQPQVQLPNEPADEADDSHVKADTSELDGEFRALDLGVDREKEKDPQSALEHFEKAIEKEDQGRLGDSLNLYRKAYRLDSKVDQAYSKKHYAHAKHHAPAAVPASSSASKTAASTTGEKLLISSFANLPIPQAEPIIENTPPPPCPIAHLPSEVLIEILKHVAILDPALFARLSLVCKRLAYHVAHEQHIWRRLCQGHEFGLASMHYYFACEVNWKPIEEPYTLDSESDSQVVHSHPFTAQLTATIPKPLTSWSHVFQAFPRLRFTGIYISTVNYMRPGANSAMQSVSWNTPIHIVTYYRYLRFYPDGTVLSLLSTAEPIEVVPHITRENIKVLTASTAARKHARHNSETPAPVPQTTSTANPIPPTAAAALKHTLRGRWRLTPPITTTSPAINPGTGSSSTTQPPPATYRQATEKEPSSSSTPDPRDLFIETEGVGSKYTYTMHLALRSVGSHKSKNTKLAWKGFWSYNQLTDDWAEFTLRNDKPFVFRRVRGWGLPG